MVALSRWANEKRMSTYEVLLLGSALAALFAITALAQSLHPEIPKAWAASCATGLSEI